MQAIRREFLHHLDQDDRWEEEVKLARLEEGGEELTPEEREAGAKSTDAGDYSKPWDTFRAAQRLFADEVAEVDLGSRDPTDKSSLGNRTKAVRAWYKTLPASKLEEATKAAEKWNTEGAPNKDKMLVCVHLLFFKGFLTEFLLSYRKKHLHSKTVKFIESLRRTMGVHCVVLVGYETPKGVKAT